jgi:hypothetical protein
MLRIFIFITAYILPLLALSPKPSAAQNNYLLSSYTYSEIGSYYAQLIGNDLNNITENKYSFNHLTDKKIGGSAPPSFFSSSFGGICKTRITDNYEPHMYSVLDRLTRSEIDLCMLRLFSNNAHLSKLKEYQSSYGFQGFEFVFSYQFPNKLVNLSYFILIDDIIARDFNVRS